MMAEKIKWINIVVKSVNARTCSIKNVSALTATKKNEIAMDFVMGLFGYHLEMTLFG
jgi:hypothetical protein